MQPHARGSGSPKRMRAASPPGSGSRTANAARTSLVQRSLGHVRSGVVVAVTGVVVDERPGVNGTLRPVTDKVADRCGRCVPPSSNPPADRSPCRLSSTGCRRSPRRDRDRRRPPCVARSRRRAGRSRRHDPLGLVIVHGRVRGQAAQTPEQPEPLGDVIERDQAVGLDLHREHDVVARSRQRSRRTSFAGRRRAASSSPRRRCNGHRLARTLPSAGTRSELLEQLV